MREKKRQRILWNLNQVQPNCKSNSKNYSNNTWNLLNTYYLVGTTESVFHNLSHLTIPLLWGKQSRYLHCKVEKWRNTEIKWLLQVTQLRNSRNVTWTQICLVPMNIATQLAGTATSSIKSIYFWKGLFSSEITQNKPSLSFLVLCSSDKL